MADVEAALQAILRGNTAVTDLVEPQYITVATEQTPTKLMAIDIDYAEAPIRLEDGAPATVEAAVMLTARKYRDVKTLTAAVIAALDGQAMPDEDVLKITVDLSSTTLEDDGLLARLLGLTVMVR